MRAWPAVPYCLNCGGPVYTYDPEFYRYINQGAVRSARIVLPALCDILSWSPAAVLDVGCGAGAWLSVWKERGAVVCGVDGRYVLEQPLLIETEEFVPGDLVSGFDLERRFDLVQCLEVAEHLPETSAADLVAALCRHGDVVLFSAAAPGQGGENHVNEQPYAYWRDLFAERGYQLYDPLRPRVKDNAEVEPWYRYNSFLFLSTEAAANLHAVLAPWRLDAARAPADVSPLPYRLRKGLVRMLPVSLGTRLAVIKRGLFNARPGAGGA